MTGLDTPVKGPLKDFYAVGFSTEISPLLARPLVTFLCLGAGAIGRISPLEALATEDEIGRAHV